MRAEVMINIPLRLPSLANLRQMPLAGAATKKHLRKVVGGYLLVHGRPFRAQWEALKRNPKCRVQVTLVRSGPQELDDDNNVSAFKPVRDEVARFIGLDDKSKRFTWHYAQDRGGYEVRLHLEAEEDASFVHVEPKPARVTRRMFKPTPNVRKPR